MWRRPTRSTLAAVATTEAVGAAAADRRKEAGLRRCVVTARRRTVAAFDEIVRRSDANPDAVEWVAERPAVVPIAVVAPDPRWPSWFVELADRIRRALGDRVLDLDHVGSTSVPDFAGQADHRHRPHRR